MLTHADGTAERDAAGLMLDRELGKRLRRRQRHGRLSVGADKAYDTREFLQLLRDMNIRPHVAQNLNRTSDSAIDARTTRHRSNQASQRKRPLIEKVFGWMKQTAGDAEDQTSRIP
jgi:hypothetical protein